MSVASGSSESSVTSASGLVGKTLGRGPRPAKREKRCFKTGKTEDLARENGEFIGIDSGFRVFYCGFIWWI
jgi:hypothetical protein